MPKNKLQEIIFTILMVFVMVYAMVCYNIALNTGGMSNAVFLAAFRELPIMMPIAFILDFFLVGNLAKKSSISHGRCKNRTSIPFDSRHLCGFCCMDVSADESGCYDFVPAPRKANRQYVAANNRL